MKKVILRILLTPITLVAGAIAIGFVMATGAYGLNRCDLTTFVGTALHAATGICCILVIVAVIGLFMGMLGLLWTTE